MKLKLSFLVLLCLVGLVMVELVLKNIIYMIGDGMGLVYIIVYCYFKDDLNIKVVDLIVFDIILCGMVYIYFDDYIYVIDSVVGVIVLSSGYKSYNGVIVVDIDKKLVKIMFEVVKECGMIIVFVVIL